MLAEKMEGLVVDLKLSGRTTSRSPISCDANFAVPPPSDAEHRRISVFPQFSTIV